MESRQMFKKMSSNEMLGLNSNDDDNWNLQG